MQRGLGHPHLVSQAALGLAWGQVMDIPWSQASACVTTTGDTGLFTPLLDLGKVKRGCCQALPGVNFASSYPWGTAAIHHPLEFSLAWEDGWGFGLICWLKLVQRRSPWPPHLPSDLTFVSCLFCVNYITSQMEHGLTHCPSFVFNLLASHSEENVSQRSLHQDKLWPPWHQAQGLHKEGLLLQGTPRRGPLVLLPPHRGGR